MKLSTINEATRRSFLKTAGKLSTAVATGSPAKMANALTTSTGTGVNGFLENVAKYFLSMDDKTKSTIESMIEIDEHGDISWSEGNELRSLFQNHVENGIVGTYNRDRFIPVAPVEAFLGYIVSKTNLNNPAEVIDHLMINAGSFRPDVENKIITSILNKGNSFVFKGVNSSKQIRNPFDMYSKLVDKKFGHPDAPEILGFDYKQAHIVRDFMGGNETPEDWKRWGKMDEYNQAYKLTQEFVKKGILSVEKMSKMLQNKFKQAAIDKKQGKEAQKRIHKETQKRIHKEKAAAEKIESERFNPSTDDLLASPMHQAFESRLNKALAFII